MDPTTVQVPALSRLLFVTIPLFLLGTLVAATIWGDYGLIALQRLDGELERTHGELARVERENQVLLRELLLLERDPLAVERAVADELRWGAEGGTLYVFEDGQGSKLDAREVPSLPELPALADDAP